MRYVTLVQDLFIFGINESISICGKKQEHKTIIYKHHGTILTPMNFSVGAIALKSSLLLSFTAVSHVNAFQSAHYSASLSTLLASNTSFGTSAARFGFGFRRPASAALRSATETKEPEIDVDTSARWESLAAELTSLDEDSSPAPTPVLTLYRDTNGWCPFCERVWICIRAKDLPYQERLIELYNKLKQKRGFSTPETIDL